MNKSYLRPCVTLELLCGKGTQRVTLNSNIVMALEEVEKASSLNAATKRLHMGYSNTYYVIKGLEKALGITLLCQKQGRSFALTEEGRWLVDLYKQTQLSAQECAQGCVEHTCNGEEPCELVDAPKNLREQA